MFFSLSIRDTDFVSIITAGPGDSLYALCNLLFPDASLLFRFLGTYLPDAGLRKQIEVGRCCRRSPAVRWRNCSAEPAF